jgi:hypothetical protein
MTFLLERVVFSVIIARWIVTRFEQHSLSRIRKVKRHFETREIIRQFNGGLVHGSNAATRLRPKPFPGLERLRSKRQNRFRMLSRSSSGTPGSVSAMEIVGPTRSRPMETLNFAVVSPVSDCVIDERSRLFSRNSIIQ